MVITFGEDGVAKVNIDLLKRYTYRVSRKIYICLFGILDQYWIDTWYGVIKNCTSGSN